MHTYRFIQYIPDGVGNSLVLQTIDVSANNYQEAEITAVNTVKNFQPILILNNTTDPESFEEIAKEIVHETN